MTLHGQTQALVAFALALAIIFIISVIVAHGEPMTTFRDSRGATTGTATTNSSGVTTFRDARGATTGTATRDGNGQTTFRDSRGATTGTAQGQRR